MSYTTTYENIPLHLRVSTVEYRPEKKGHHPSQYTFLTYPMSRKSGSDTPFINPILSLFSFNGGSITEVDLLGNQIGKVKERIGSSESTFG